MTPLEKMQEKSKKRHAGFKGYYPTIVENGNRAYYEPVQDEKTVGDFFKEQEEIKFVDPIPPEAYDAPPVKPINDEPPKYDNRIDFEKVAKYVKPIPEDKPDLKFKRPPAEYSNKSPYGIASDLHQGKDL